MTGSTTEAMKCPDCGSHSFRAFHVDANQKADLHCLTCGHEWKHEVTKNLDGNLKGAAHPQDFPYDVAKDVAPTPLQPGLEPTWEGGDGNKPYVCPHCNAGLSEEHVQAGICPFCSNSLHGRAQIPINPVHESRLFIRAIVVSVDLFLRVMEKMQRLVKTVMTFF